MTTACDREKNRAQLRSTSSPVSAMSIRDPVPGRSSFWSIFFAVLTNRTAAMPTVAVPRTISASPAMLPKFWPGNDRVRPARGEQPPPGTGRTFPLGIRRPSTAIAVRTQARSWIETIFSAVSPSDHQTAIKLAEREGVTDSALDYSGSSSETRSPLTGRDYRAAVYSGTAAHRDRTSSESGGDSPIIWKLVKTLS